MDLPTAVVYSKTRLGNRKPRPQRGRQVEQGGVVHRCAAATAIPTDDSDDSGCLVGVTVEIVGDLGSVFDFWVGDSPFELIVGPLPPPSLPLQRLIGRSSRDSG